mgnify:CR=1 FL=1|tara:strand:- start:924 stop:1409 length:486 start_codon:yes stop_codon:yes gene_type:complete
MMRAKKRLLVEQDGGGSMTGAVGGFVGRHGQDVDATYMGPFHPDYGEVEKLLQLQLDRRDELVKWNSSITPILKNVFEKVGIEYKFDQPISDEDKKKLLDFINDTDKMKLVNTGIKYDKPSNRSKEDTENLINRSNDWQEVFKNKKDKTTSDVKEMFNAWR